ncbi:hypothetical protein EJ06DRAFT_557391 [Trichodelitschia bisporula]|uniref:C2H2-type domain-containing protein n=1 Tax=Trichodelitschia bisporula TaxID=703511 RepID=A0A6G1HU62_9PEZI|nr:hypothetical protein EJ06DRAFT_557391 [Trichodelitschia bisporula]
MLDKMFELNSPYFPTEQIYPQYESEMYGTQAALPIQYPTAMNYPQEYHTGLQTNMVGQENRTWDMVNSNYTTQAYDARYPNSQWSQYRTQTEESAYGSSEGDGRSDQSLDENSRFGDRSNSGMSVTSRSSKKPHCCAACNAEFARKADLTRHFECTHDENSKRFDCTMPRCSRKGREGFTRKDHLTEHLRNYHQQDIPKNRRRKMKDGSMLE